MRAGASEWGSEADTLCGFGYGFLYHGVGGPDTHWLNNVRSGHCSQQHIILLQRNQVIVCALVCFLFLGTDLGIPMLLSW